MALDDFQMPSFKDPDGSTYIWDSSTQSYVKAPLTDKRPDQSHATGGDNDLFDPFQHTEMDSVPELEGYMAKKACLCDGKEDTGCPECGPIIEKKTAFIDEPPFPQKDEVKCPNCGETTSEMACPTCQKDLTPEWNVQGQQNEFFDAKPDFNDATEHWTWPQNVPHQNPEKTDNSFPSMSLSKTAADVFDLLEQFKQQNSRPAYELGRATAVMAFDPELRGQAEEVYNAWNVNPEFTKAWNDALDWAGHPQMPPETREMYRQEFQQLRQALGSTKTAEALPTDNWDDMFADQAPIRSEAGRWVEDINGQLHVGMGDMLHDQIAARDGFDVKQSIALGSVYNDGTADVQQVFQKDYFDLEQVEHLLQQAFGPVTLQPPLGLADYEQKGHVFPPTDIQGGQWFIPPYTGTITGTAWVKDRPEGVEYKPNMILVAEHLRPDDVVLWTQGCAAIVTAVGGASSHAAYLAMTEAIPVIVGIGDSYNKVETGNYVKIEPTSETITVMPGATSAMPSEQKHEIWNSILDYQRQRGGSVSQPEFSHFHEELAWKEANGPNLEECPECRAPMFDRADEAQCGDCGHKQPIIHSGAMAALPLAAEMAGGGEAAAAGGAAGGGMGGIGGLMTKALRPGFGMGMMMGRGEGGGGDGGAAGGGPAPIPFDENAGTVAHVAGMQREAILSEIWGLVQNALQAIKGGASAINWNGIANAVAANPLDDAAIGGLSAINQHVQNQYQQATSATTFGEEEVGVANKNDGTNSTDEASNSGTEGKEEQGDGPEQLKDVDGGHGSQDSAAGDNLKSDPQMQDKALKAFHMNLPLVIEFAGSDEAGSDNPLLAALDSLLEEAFPGYKGGFDEDAGATTEHPEEESETPEDRDKEPAPDKKSEGADKAARKIASVWHYAWGDEPGRGYNEGMEMDPEAYGGPKIYVQCPNCQHGETYADFEKAELEGRDPYACPQCGEQMADPNQDPFHEPDDDQAVGDYEMYGPDQPTMEDTYLEGGPHMSSRILKEGVWHFAIIQGGEPSAWAVRDSLQAPTQWGQPRLQQPEGLPPQVQGDPSGFQPMQGQPEAYSCRNCGEQEQFPRNVDPRDLPLCPQCGERAWTHSGLQQTYSSLDPGQAPMGGTPAGAGGPAMQICPRCGQAHTGGAPCPVADVTTPLTTGDSTSQAMPANKVVTKWRLANPALPASQPQMAAGAPAAPSTCPSCGCNHIPGTPCPQSPQQMQQPGAGGANTVSPPVGPGVAYSAFEDSLRDLPEVTSDENPEAESPKLDHGDYHSDDDWKDEGGTPLQEGSDYEMKTAHSPIPDRVTIEKILPEKLTYLIHSGDVDYRDTITRDQLDLDGAVFSALDMGDTGEDSMDTFSDEEMPVRPGQDALPQQDDLSVPSTTVSHFEPISLDNYTGSYAGDAPDDRSWLIEGDSSEVAVDPVLMAKMAAKNYSPREQREFIEEKGTARNLDRLDLEGTHYIDEELGTADSLW